MFVYRHFFSPADRYFLILEGCTKCWKGPLLLPSRVPPTLNLRPFFQFGSLTNKAFNEKTRKMAGHKVSVQTTDG